MAASKIPLTSIQAEEKFSQKSLTTTPLAVDNKDRKICRAGVKNMRCKPPQQGTKPVEVLEISLRLTHCIGLRCENHISRCRETAKGTRTYIIALDSKKADSDTRLHSTVLTRMRCSTYKVKRRGWLTPRGSRLSEFVVPRDSNGCHFGNVGYRDYLHGWLNELPEYFNQ